MGASTQKDFLKRVDNLKKSWAKNRPRCYKHESDRKIIKVEYESRTFQTEYVCENFISEKLNLKKRLMLDAFKNLGDLAHFFHIHS